MIDAHCHLHDALYQANEVDELVKKARQGGVRAILTNGGGIHSSKQTLELANRFSDVFAAIGIHPEEIQDIVNMDKNETKQLLLNMASDKKVVAIGESGLDYTDKTTETDMQAQWDLLQINIEVARTTGLPLVVHCRNAFDDIFRLIDYPLVQMHCFTGSEDQMLECIKRGWYVSFGGIITFKRSEGLRLVAANVPADRLLIETDAPYLAPEPFRGSRNEPANVKIVASAIAQARGVSVDQIAELTTTNALALFRKIKI